MRSIVLISGHIGAGKSEIAKALAHAFDATVIKSRAILVERFGELDRAELQRRGAQLDTETGGRWLAESFAPLIDRDSECEVAVIDAVRVLGQVEGFREAFGNRVLHVHVECSATTRERRYEAREPAEELSFEQAMSDATEAQVDTLARDADVIVETERTTGEQVAFRLASRLGLSTTGRARLVDVLIGAQWGSEGKGNVAGYLAPEYDLLVRTGGPNSGHSVLLPDGTKRVQYHLPSGTSLSSARLALGPGAVINPKELLNEIRVAGVDPKRLAIDHRATVITEGHQESERRLVESIGSTGSGVGAAVMGRIGDRDSGSTLAKDVPELRAYLQDTAELLQRCYDDGERVFVEGTQGTGLSLLHGSYPHVTSRDTTVGTLLAEAGIAPKRLRKTVLVVRTYPIRVADPVGKESTSGPMFNEIAWEDVAQRSGLDLTQLKKQEMTSRTHKQRRVGEFDWELLYRAVQLNGPTDIAVTFVDQMSAQNLQARRYDQLTPETIRFVEEIESVAGAPATLISTRFHNRSIIDRRSW